MVYNMKMEPHFKFQEKTSEYYCWKLRKKKVKY